MLALLTVIDMSSLSYINLASDDPFDFLQTFLILVILFRPFNRLTLEDLKLFGFQFVDFKQYMMVILETCRVH